VARGSSFDQSLIKELDETVFLINWPQKIEGENIYYATADQGDVLSFKAKGLFPILYVRLSQTNSSDDIEEIVWRPGVKELFDNPSNKHIKIRTRNNNAMPDLGSGICIISAIRNYADKLELHGWDHYLTSGPGDKGYVGRLLDLLFGSPSYKLLPISLISKELTS
jgi:hypothetical protein